MGDVLAETQVRSLILCLLILSNDLIPMSKVSTFGLLRGSSW